MKKEKQRLPASVVDERMSAFREACEAKRVKVTHQRLEIYRELASTEEHPDADALHQRVRRRIPTISRDTVYRNLRLLASHGLISVVGMSHERLRFDANMGRHHHFVCVRCGLIRDFQTEGFDSLSIPAEAEAFGEATSLHLEVKGVCTDCRGRNQDR